MPKIKVVPLSGDNRNKWVILERVNIVNQVAVKSDHCGVVVGEEKFFGIRLVIIDSNQSRSSQITISENILINFLNNTNGSKKDFTESFCGYGDNDKDKILLIQNHDSILFIVVVEPKSNIAMKIVIGRDDIADFANQKS